MKKNLWQLIVPLALVVLTLVVYALATRDKEKEPDVVRVEQGVFEIVVSGTGELEALESTNIMIPDVLADRTVRIRSIDRKSTRLNSSHVRISYAVFCLKKKT